MSKIIKGYKAFNKDMTCNGFKYEVGKEYKHDGELEICSSGFHFCKNPLDVLNYYDLTNCEFAEVEALGKIVSKKDEDSKIATDHIKIGAKLDLPAFIKASFDFLWENCNKKDKSDKDLVKLASSGNDSKLASSGNDSKLASSGNDSKLASSGNNSKLASSGYNSQLEINGDYSVGANIGINSKIKGKKGTWITLAEYDDNFKPIFVLSAQIDGKKIKADTWYELKNKKFKEVK